MDFNEVIAIKEELKPEDFLREVLKNLYEDEEAPTNVFDAKFGTVERYTEELLYANFQIEVDYNGSVGYDREEVYYEEKAVSDSSTDYDFTRGGTKYKRVKKTRTVTDWSPFHGHDSFERGTTVNNGEPKHLDLHRLFPRVAQKIKKESLSRGEASAKLSAYNAAKEECVRDAEMSVEWPGDHYKDAHYTSNATQLDLTGYIVPCYRVLFSLEGNTYEACGFAAGAPLSEHQTPVASGNAETVKQYEDIFHAETEKDGKRAIIVYALSGVAALAGLVTAICIQSATPFWIGAIAGIVASIAAAIIKKVRWNKHFAEFTEQKNRIQNIKKIGMDRKKKEMGLA